MWPEDHFTPSRIKEEIEEIRKAVMAIETKDLAPEDIPDYEKLRELLNVEEHMKDVEDVSSTPPPRPKRRVKKKIKQFVNLYRGNEGELRFTTIVCGEAPGYIRTQEIEIEVEVEE